MKKILLLFSLLCCLLAGGTNAQTVDWLRQGTSATSADYSGALGTATDASGNVYVVGYFSGSVAFGTTTLVSAGGNDIFLAKYDATGAFQWAKRAGGTDADIGYGVAVSGTEVYITGSFNGTANFNTPTATGSNEIVSAGGSDIFLAKYDATGAFQWANRAGGTDPDRGNGVAVSGTAVYLTGSFNSTANFNTPTATGSNEIVSAGSSDIFLAKYDATGALQWAKRAGGTGTDDGNGVAVSGTAVYITGYFNGTANFNTSTATGSNEIVSAGGSDIFLAKYNDTGAFQWANRAGGTGNEVSNGVAVSGTVVYLTGYFNGTANFNSPSLAGSNEIVSAGANDIFLAKYDATGAFQWVTRAGGTGNEVGNGVAVSGTAVYITGYFRGTANFNNPSLAGSNEIVSATSGANDIFLAKYEATGAFQWANRAGGTSHDYGYGVAVSGTAVYITGYFGGTANFNNPSTTGSNELTTIATSGDAFLAKYGLAVASITATGTPTAFSACAGTASTYQSITVGGSNLTADITVTALTGFEVSTTSGSGFGSSATLTPSGGSVATTTIYVRMAATATGTPSGNVTVASTGATDKTVAVSGTVNALPTAYIVTGTGSYCTGGTGVAVGLANSETGVTYQLKKDGVDEEPAKAGTGSALTWANKTAGTYTIVATRTTGGCMATMTGSVSVTAVTPLTKTWVGTTNNWNTASNWNPSGVPHECDNVIISSSSQVPVISTTVSRIGTTTINEGRAISINAGGTFNNTGAITVNGHIDIGGTSGTGTLNNNSPGTITVNGVDVNRGDGYLLVRMNSPGIGTLNNNSGATITLNNYAYLEISPNNTVTNAGTINNNSNCLLWVKGGLSGAGGINNSSGAITGNGGVISGSLYTNPVGSTIHFPYAEMSEYNCLSFNNGLTNAGNILFQIGGTTSCTEYDKITVTGTATLGGTFSAQLINGYNPPLNTTFDVITATAISGTFTNNSINLGGGKYANIYYTATKVQLKIENFELSTCVTPTAYNVTGGGSYCAGGTGIAVGLANSETGVTYQLKRGTTDVSTQSGTTGQAITFGNQTTAGTYTVVATRTTGGCTATMTGSVDVTVNALPTLILGTIPAINTGATSFTIPYTASTESPTSYSISGTGITGVTNGTLPATPITVALNPPASGSSIAFNLTVKNANNCTSANISGSVTVTPAVVCPSGNTLHVNASVSGGTGDGTSWANAYTSLSDALATAHACSNVTLIKVAAGTYKPTKKPFNAGVEIALNVSGGATTNRDFTFHIPDGMTIEGGYDASTGNRNITANVTTLSGDIGTASDNTDNCYHVVLTSTASSNTTSTIKIDGFAITAGNANGVTPVTVNGNMVFANNGGGIITYYGKPTLTNNTIYSNSTIYNGGGIFTNNGTATLTNNAIYSNSGDLGGGIYTSNGGHTLTNNTIYSNSANLSGGGIYTSGSTTTLTNNTIYSNSANSSGGGISASGSTNTLTNNIFWGNKKGTNATVAGADFSNGTNTFKNNLLQLASGDYTSTNSNELGTSPSGNIFAQDPLFASTTAPINLALQATSPCINAGISGVGIPTTDITGATRTGNPDLGAYEYFAPALPFITRWDLSKTGSGATQISFGVGTTGTVNYTWQQVGGSAAGSGTFTGSTATITGLPSGGIIDLSISPTNFNRFLMNGGSDAARLTQIKQWGTTAWASMQSAFSGCSNMTLTATDVPNTAAVTNMSFMFFGCTAFNQALPANFNTAAVTNMSQMFSNCTAYDKALPANFNTAAVTDMSGMFFGCTAYNQALPANFNTAAVTNMQSMFSGCSAYNQALPANFNTAAVTNMQGMFASCRAYNQALPANFNTAAVTNMLGMFNGCTAYNQALPANFNTAAVTNMLGMFSGATAFNQSLAGLQLNANVNLANFLDNSGLSVANYDATLTAFKNSGVTGRTMGALGLKYCAAEADKDILVKTVANGGLGWTITDGGKLCPTATTLTLGTAINTSNCTGTPNGSIAFTSSGFAAGNQTLNYKKDNVTATPATVSIAADGTFTLTDLEAGVYSDFAIGSTTATGSKTLVLETTLPQFTLNSNSPQCERSSVSIYSSLVNPDIEASFTYLWSGPASFSSANANVLISPLQPANAGTYTLEVTNTATGCKATETITVVVFPLPNIPTITPSAMQLCKGESVLLTGTCSAATDIFRWTTPPLLGNSLTSLTNINQRIITTPGVYKGLCESKDGCLSDEVSITITEKVNCSPVFITVSPTKAAICPGSSVQLTASGCTSGTLTWYGGASPQTGTSITASPTATTEYTVLCSTGGSGSVTVAVAQPTVAVPSDIVTGQDYIKATQTITSDKKVGYASFTPAPSVRFEAGNSITLLPGFVAEKWSTFSAEIKGCPQN